MVIRQGTVGGGETHLYDLATNLDTDLFHVTVLSFSDGEMVDKLRKKGIDTNVIESGIPFDLRVQLKLIDFLKNRKIQIIHAHGSRAASNMLFPARRLNIRLIYTVHGWSFNDAQRKLVRFLRIRAERVICKRANQVICVSQSNAETGIKYLGKWFKPAVIYNGISFANFDYQMPSETGKLKLGLSTDFIWVALIARMTEQKDPINLLKAYKLAFKHNAKIGLLLIGEGNLDAEIDEFIKENGLKEVIKLPFQQNVPEILSAIDIYCLVSLWEGMPIGLLEAMAMKRACIVSDVDGTREVIKNGLNGLVVERSNSSELADAIIQLAKHKEMRIDFGENAFKTVKERFGLKKMVNETIRFY